MITLQKVLSNNYSYDFIDISNKKYNDLVVLDESDKKNKIKIYCKEKYAQDAFNLYKKYFDDFKERKDFFVGEILKVKAKVVSFKDKTIIVEELQTKSNIIIPFKEYSKSLDDLLSGKDSEFLVMVYKVSKTGECFASEKKCISLNYKKELFDHLNNNTWFDVKIIKLIKGGYLALYKDNIECFIPGSHAAANIIHDFNILLGKTITVMVDNYDKFNDLFILSNKKYISYSMPIKITELSFDKEYTGKLTNDPYDFGVFVEFDDGYFTGLIHKSEFDNYELAKKKMKAGDSISFYIKDVIFKNNQYRIVLTLDKNKINSERQEWENIKRKIENKSFKYEIDYSKNCIKISIEDKNLEFSLKKSDFNKNLSKYPIVRISKVDPINKKVKFEFVKYS